MIDIDIDDTIAKLRAVQPFAYEMAAVDETRAAKQGELALVNAQLAAARDTLVSIEAERDRARAEFANCRAELLVIQAALNAAYRERDEIERQNKRKGA